MRRGNDSVDAFAVSCRKQYLIEKRRPFCISNCPVGGPPGNIGIGARTLFHGIIHHFFYIPQLQEGQQIRTKILAVDIAKSRSLSVLPPLVHSRTPAQHATGISIRE